MSSTSVFFRHIHPWFPFLDSQLVLQDLAGVREPTLLHYAIFGASIPFLYDPRLDDTRSDSFWKYTKRRVFAETSEEPSYAALEAATILTLDLSGMTNGPQVWSRLAVVARLAAQLRTASGRVLRQSVPGGSWEGRLATSRPSARQHAKLFWAIYALDSFISITTSQPALLTEHILRTFRPTREAAWCDQTPYSSDSPSTSYGNVEPCTYSASAAFLKLLQLLDVSRSFHDLYLSYITLPRHSETQAVDWLETFHSLSHAADDLLQGLPSWCQLPINPESDVHHTSSNPHTRRLNTLATAAHIRDIQAPVIMLHAYGHALTIYMNGLLEFSDHQAISALSAGARQDASTRCAKSARAIFNIATMFVETHGDRIGWPFPWSIWTAARYLLTSAQALGSPQPSSEFYMLLACLRDLGKYWQISKKYWWLLHHAAESLVAADLASRIPTAGVGDGSSHRADEMPSPGAGQERPRNPGRMLSIVTDLRVPTSDVEDQFRVDPVFSVPSTSEGSATGAEGNGSPIESHREPPWPSERTNEPGHTPFLDEIVRNESLYMSDTWFNSPLFATSGYQQFGENAAAMMEPPLPLH